MASKACYCSVETSILAKAFTAPYNYDETSVEQVHWDIRDKVWLHKNPQLTVHEKDWLTELLFWEKLFPAEIPGFPGKRPSNPDHPHHKVAHGYMPSCSTCVEQGLKDDDCPYVRHVVCERKLEHPVYMVRLGSEDFIGDDCPACYGEELDGRGKRKVVDGSEEKTGEKGKGVEGRDGYYLEGRGEEVAGTERR